MKFPRSPYVRVVALTTAMVVTAGAVAVADTLSVTLLSVRGTRTLQVTNPAGTGPATLSFGPGSLSSPFGVTVTDVAYDRKGYQVTATLSDLYRLGETGVVCEEAARVPSGAFEVDPGDTLPTDDPGALVQSIVDFSAEDITADLTTALNDVLTSGTLTNLDDIDDLTDLIAGLTGPMPLNVDDVGGLPRPLTEAELGADLAGLGFMTVAADGPATVFADEDAHPGCDDTGVATPTSVTLQTGTPDDTAPGTGFWTALETAAFETAESDADADTVLTPVEAADGGILSDLATTAPTDPATDNEDAGELWLRTNETLDATLADDVRRFLGELGLAQLTSAVVGDLVAQTGDLTYRLIGQSGVYGSVPTLTFDPDEANDPTTGLYHGVMTVTLVSP